MLIGDKIRKIRKEKNFTLKDVSNQTDISLPFLSDIERGDANPSIATLEKLAVFYNLQLAELLSDVENSQIERVYPKELVELQQQHGLSNDWLNTLINVQYRGKQPSTKEEWLTLYLNLKQLLDK